MSYIFDINISISCFVHFCNYDVEKLLCNHCTKLEICRVYIAAFYLILPRPEVSS